MESNGYSIFNFATVFVTPIDAIASAVALDVFHGRSTGSKVAPNWKQRRITTRFTSSPLLTLSLSKLLVIEYLPHKSGRWIRAPFVVQHREMNASHVMFVVLRLPPRITFTIYTYIHLSVVADTWMNMASTSIASCRYRGWNASRDYMGTRPKRCRCGGNAVRY